MAINTLLYRWENPALGSFNSLLKVTQQVRGKVEFKCRLLGKFAVVSTSLKASGEGNGNPLQYSCLENPMNGGAWQAAVQGIAKESDMTERTHSEEEKKKGYDKKFKEIIVENFPNKEKEIVNQIQEAQRVS